MAGFSHIFTFYSLGVVVYFPPIIVGWIANEDILSGSSYPSAIVTIAHSMDIMGKIVAVFVIDRAPFVILMLLHSTVLSGGFVALVLLEVHLRIIGVIITGFFYGFGVVLFLRQTAYFEHSERASSAFMSGSNVAALLASIVYTGLTTWTCAAPRVVIASCIPLCLITLAFYPFLANKSWTGQKRDTTTYHRVSQAPTSKDIHEPHTSRIGKIEFFFKAFPVVSSFFVTYFCLFISMTAILTTLTFPNSSILPRDNYQYYRLVSDIGIALGGLEVVLVSCMSQKHVQLFRIRRVWVLTLLLATCALVYLFATWFRFLPNVYTLLVVVFVQGIINGLFKIHGIAAACDLFHDVRDRARLLGYVEISISISRLTAALIGLFVEPMLKQHCSNALLLGQYCLGRIPTTNGWETNVHC